MFLYLDEVRLHYNLAGSGDPLILLHGNSEDCGIFEPLAAKLKDHFSVYSIDSRNHGQSQRTEDIGYEAMTRDVGGFIEKLGLGPALLAGFSDGAIIGLMLAMERPEAVKKMVLMGPNMSPDDLTPEARAFIGKLIEDTGSRLFKMILEEPRLRPEDLAEIETPALVVFGQNDIFKPEASAALVGLLRNASLKIVPGHDHLSYVVGSDLLFPDMLAFFKP
jgi:pimeloyl-ACP methyl ester carboxylesterase